MPHLSLTFINFNYINEIRRKLRRQHNNLINSNVSKYSYTIELKLNESRIKKSLDMKFFCCL